MNICYVATDSAPWGATLSLIDLIEKLKERGINPFVIVSGEGYLTEKLEKLDITFEIIHFYGTVDLISKQGTLKWYLKYLRKKIFEYLDYSKVIKFIKNNKIDLVHFNALTVDGGYKAFIHENIPVVWHAREFVREDLKMTFFNPKEMFGRLASASEIIGISEAICSKLTKVNLDCIEIYDHINKIYDLTETEAGTETETETFGIVARIHQNKGQLDVVKAFSNLVKRDEENIFLRVVGKSNDSKYFEEIRKYIEFNDLEKFVKLVGEKKSSVEAWRNIDIAVIASKLEAFGRTTVEAMLLNKIVIGADTGGTKEIIEKIGSGLLYEEGDIEDLTKQMKEALNLYRSQSYPYEVTREKAIREFSSNKNVAQVYELYNKVLREKNE